MNVSDNHSGSAGFQKYVLTLKPRQRDYDKTHGIRRVIMILRELQFLHFFIKQVNQQPVTKRYETSAAGL